MNDRELLVELKEIYKAKLLPEKTTPDGGTKMVVYNHNSVEADRFIAVVSLLNRLDADAALGKIARNTDLIFKVLQSRR